MRGTIRNNSLFKRVPAAKELLAGIGIYFIIVELLILVITLLFFKEQLVMWTLGFMEGAFSAAVLTIHMALSVEDAVSMLEEEALKHTRVRYIARTAGLFVWFILIGYFKLGDIIAALLGLMSLKVAAYIQPLTHKYYEK